MRLPNPASAQRLALTGLASLVSISLGIALADLTWHLSGDAGGEVAAPLGVDASASAATKTDLTPILALAPFGSSTPIVAETGPQETSLGLVLHGVALAEPETLSTAIIAAAGGEPRIYAIGETLPGAAILQAVAADSVTLNVAGRLETLSFPVAPQGTAGAGATPRPAPTVTGPVNADEGVSTSIGAVPDARPDPNQPSRGPRTADADAIAEDFRQRIASNPQTVLTDVGLVATADGYRLDDSMMPDLKRAGLQPGDVVVRVNGNKVGDVERDKDLFDAVVASGRARVEVMRDGDLIVMSFPLR